MSARDPSFGVITLRNSSWGQVVERWQTLETLGFDSAWIADHFVDFTQPSRPWFEAWTLLAGLATQTSRLRIGTLVTSIAFRNPAFLARQVVTVDHLSKGRLEIGLGTGISGEIDLSYAMTGIDDWTPRERVARFREVVVIVDQVLRNEVSSYQGRYYQIKDARPCKGRLERSEATVPSFLFKYPPAQKNSHLILLRAPHHLLTDKAVLTTQSARESRQK